MNAFDTWEIVHSQEKTSQPWPWPQKPFVTASFVLGILCSLGKFKIFLGEMILEMIGLD